MRSILVLRGGALGDFIVTLPALAALRQRWPAARIELVGNATAAQLARHRGLLDAVHSQHESRWSALYGTAPLPPAFAGWLAEFDLIVNYWPDPDGELVRRFPLRAGQQFLTAPAMPACRPAAAHYAAPLAPLGLEVRDYHIALAPHPPPAPRTERAGITVHPGSGSPRKNWPASHWRELFSELPRPLSLILGEAENDAWATFAAPGVTFLRSVPLENLVVHLSQTRLFLGHDSGISHLAAACGAPCLLLFGPTDPTIWAPPAPQMRVLQRGSELSAITIDDVKMTLAPLLPSRA